MNRTNFFDGMEISASDLQYAQAALAQQIKNNRTDIVGAGVTSSVDDYVQLDPATNGSTQTPTIRILPFSAYNYSGERIQTALTYGLALDLTNLADRRLGEQGDLSEEDFGWEPSSTLGGSTTYYICVKYIERGARPLPQDGSDIAYASRVYSGYEFYALRQGVDSFLVDGINPYIILATATYTETIVDDQTIKTLTIQNKGVTQYATIDGSKVGSTPSTTPTSVYDMTSTNAITLRDHINAYADINSVSPKNPHGITAEFLGIDKQSVPTHEKLFHSDGLLAGDKGINTQTSGLYTMPVKRLGVVDLLRCFNLASDELLHYKGSSVTYFISNEVNYADITLSDSNGTWPDGTYKLYINTTNNNLVINVPSGSEASSRSYSIQVNGGTSSQSFPVVGDIDTSIHYLIYTFDFKQIKGISSATDGESNYITLIDNRTFGSISSANLQRNSKGVFYVDNTIGVDTILFRDNSTLNTAANFIGQRNISNCITSNPSGVFTVSDNRIRIKKDLSLLLPNGLSSDGLYNSESTRYLNDVNSTSEIPTTAGTYYILVGAFSGGATQDELYFATDYTVSGTQPVSPEEYNCWYNPDTNLVKIYISGAWSNFLKITKIGHIVIDENGDVSKVYTDSSFKLVDYNTYREMLGFDNPKLSSRETIVGWGMPDESRAVSRSENVEYTADTDGLLMGSVGMGKSDHWYLAVYNSDATPQQISDSEYEVAGGYEDNWTADVVFFSRYIKKGQKYKLRHVSYHTTAGLRKFTFNPLTGVI